MKTISRVILAALITSGTSATLADTSTLRLTGRGAGFSQIVADPYGCGRTSFDLTFGEYGGWDTKGPGQPPGPVPLGGGIVMTDNFCTGERRFGVPVLFPVELQIGKALQDGAVDVVGEVQWFGPTGPGSDVTPLAVSLTWIADGRRITETLRECYAIPDAQVCTKSVGATRHAIARGVISVGTASIAVDTSAPDGLSTARLYDSKSIRKTITVSDSVPHGAN